MGLISDLTLFVECFFAIRFKWYREIHDDNYTKLWLVQSRSYSKLFKPLSEYSHSIRPFFIPIIYN